MPLGLSMTSRNCLSVVGVHADLGQVERDDRAVEHPHDDALAEHRGQHADAQIDRVAADGQLDAAVLRQAALGDVEVGHHLDAGGDGERQVPRRRNHFEQHAVGLDADAELVLERLEVQVAGVVLDRQQQHHVQQLADRGAVGQGLDVGQVDRPVRLERLRPLLPARRRPPASSTMLSTLSLLSRVVALERLHASSVSVGDDDADVVAQERPQLVLNVRFCGSHMATVSVSPSKSMGMIR